jgi:hypothetical protein
MVKLKETLVKNRFVDIRPLYMCVYVCIYAMVPLLVQQLENFFPIRGIQNGTVNHSLLIQ